MAFNYDDWPFLTAEQKEQRLQKVRQLFTEAGLEFWDFIGKLFVVCCIDEPQLPRI